MKKYRILLFVFAALIFMSWNKSGYSAVKNMYTSNLSDTTVCDMVYDGRYMESSHLTLISLGAPSPAQKVTILIKGSDRDKFPSPPEKSYSGKTVCVKGPVQMNMGRPEILVSDPAQIVVQQ